MQKENVNEKNYAKILYEQLKDEDSPLYRKVVELIPMGTILPIPFISKIRNALSSPSLAPCTYSSLQNAVLTAAQNGLAVGGEMSQADIIPRTVKKKVNQEDTYIMLANLEINYHGLRALAYRTELVKSISCQMVYAKDVFKCDLGKRNPIKHEPYLGEGERGAIVAAYGILRLTSGESLVEILNLAQIREFQSKYSPKNTLWNSNLEAMWKKTIVKKLCRQIPDKGIRQSWMKTENLEHVAEESPFYADMPHPFDTSHVVQEGALEYINRMLENSPYLNQNTQLDQSLPHSQEPVSTDVVQEGK